MGQDINAQGDSDSDYVKAVYKWVVKEIFVWSA